jgi:hypothetical protein
VADINQLSSSVGQPAFYRLPFFCIAAGASASGVASSFLTMLILTVEITL